MMLPIIFLGSELGHLERSLTFLAQRGMFVPLLLIRPDMTGLFIDGDEARDVNPRSFVADSIIARATVVMSSDGQPHSDSAVEFATWLRAELEHNGGVIDLITVIAPMPNAQIDAEAIIDYWTLNAIVPPYDTLGEWSTASEPFDSVQQRDAALVSVVAAFGGLWTWMVESPLAGGLFRSLLSGGDKHALDDKGTVRIVRPLTRIVDAGDLMSRVVDQALTPGAKLPPPPGLVLHGEPRQAVEHMFNALAPQRNSPLGISYSRPEPEPSPVEHLGILEAIKRYVGEVLAELRHMPSAAVDRTIGRVKESIENAVQKGTYGSGSRILVAFDGPTDTEMILDSSARSRFVEAETGITLPEAAPTPATWKGLVATTLAAVDGSEVAEAFSVASLEWGSQRAVLIDRELLAPASIIEPDGGAFTLTPDQTSLLGLGDSGVVVGPFDAVAFQTISGITERAVDQPIRRPEFESDDDEQIPSSSDVPSGEAPSSSSSSTSPLVDGSEQLQELKGRLDEWHTQRGKSLLWRLATQIADNQRNALDDIALAEQGLIKFGEQAERQIEAERQSRRRFRKGILIALGIGLTLILGVMGAIAAALISVLVGVVGVFLTLIGAALRMVSLARQRVRERNQADDTLRHAKYLNELRYAATIEYGRLGSLYAQYQDWARVAGLALHRPFKPGMSLNVEAFSVTHDCRSFVVGTPHVAPAAVAAHVAQAMQSVARPGWLNAAYSDQRRELVREYSVLTENVSAAVDEPELDSDLSQNVLLEVTGSNDLAAVRIERSRSHFVNEMVAGSAAMRYRKQLAKELLQAFSPQHMMSLVERVECSVSGLNEPPRGLGDFLTPIMETETVPGLLRDFLSGQPLIDGYRKVSFVGATPGFSFSESHGHSPVEVIVPPDRLLFAAIRVEISEPLPLTNIAVIAKGDADGDRPGSGPSSRPDRDTPPTSGRG